MGKIFARYTVVINNGYGDIHKCRQKIIEMPIVTDEYGFTCYGLTTDEVKKYIKENEIPKIENVKRWWIKTIEIN